MNMRTVSHWLVATLLFVLCGLAGAAAAQESKAIQANMARYAGEFEVPIHKSRVVTVDRPFGDVLVGNPNIADVLPLTDRSLYILGKNLGSTSLTIYGRNGDRKDVVAVVDLVVTHNLEGLKRRLFDLLPDEKIQVRTVNDSVVLSGTLSNSTQVANVLSVAERYSPGKVTNMLKVKGNQQVMLAVRIAEVKRFAFKDIGINTNILYQSGGTAISLLTGIGAPVAAFGLLSTAVSLMDGSLQINAALDALEQKGVLKTLAEPNLIALSGDTASFLAGGEFPIPVTQSVSAGVGSITIEFKQFGVSLAFTPTVLEQNLISLVVAPEVSALDPTTRIQISGTSIPGLTTRRAKTTVELRDGQSFAIAGLIQSDFRDQIDQLPFAGDVPVLGALFRSAEYRRDETELVIIVTPHLVKPARAGDLALPTDQFTPPSEAEFFLLGRPEARSAQTSSGTSTLPAAQARAPAGGGLDGNFGHIIK